MKRLLIGCVLMVVAGLALMLAGCWTKAELKAKEAADKRSFFEGYEKAKAQAEVEAAKPGPPKPEILKFDTDKEMQFWERVYEASIIAISREGGTDYRTRVATENADLAVQERRKRLTWMRRLE